MAVHRGRRWSTANAYLKPAAGRANLEVACDALATRIVLDGRRVRGLEYRQDGAIRRWKRGAKWWFAAGRSTRRSS